VPTVAAALTESGLDPAALWLEITESTIMCDTDVAEATVRAIGALGVRLSIDDFGTGYSSLSHLRRLPIQALKIHRSFVAGLGHGREDEAIVAMIVGLARTLGLHVVADGVETAEQVAHLDRLGCVYLQGSRFAPPGPLPTPVADPVGADLGVTSVA
jgi:EAL domain-containing protein (putative c-di-GMP-specific phosphodiesterase class I)